MSNSIIPNPQIHFEVQTFVASEIKEQRFVILEIKIQRFVILEIKVL
jgi:hypothetical protein